MEGWWKTPPPPSATTRQKRPVLIGLRVKNILGVEGNAPPPRVFAKHPKNGQTDLNQTL